MPWYYAGTLLAMPVFLGIFSYPEFINNEISTGVYDESKRKIWYITLPAVFNVGWASVQISNMSIVNNLTSETRRRDRLSNSRNAFTAGANMIVLTTALVLFSLMDDPI